MRYQEVLDETRQLMPIFRQRVPETNNLRQLPSATCDDIRRSGMAHVLQPARYGGVELSQIDGGRANTDRLRLQRHGLVPRPTAVSGSDWCVLSGMMGVVDGGPAFESYFLLAHFGDCNSCS